MGKDEKLKSKYDIYENEDNRDGVFCTPGFANEGHTEGVEADSETVNSSVKTISRKKNKSLVKLNKRLEKQAKKFSHRNLGVAIYKAKFLHHWLESLVLLTVVGNMINWIVIHQDSQAYWDKQFTTRQAFVVVTVSTLQCLYFIIFIVWLAIFSVKYYRYRTNTVK